MSKTSFCISALIWEVLLLTFATRSLAAAIIKGIKRVFNLFDNRRRCPDAEFTEITWHFEGEFATERSVTAVGVHFLARDQLFSYARKLVVGGYEPNAQSQEDR